MSLLVNTNYHNFRLYRSVVVVVIVVVVVAVVVVLNNNNSSLMVLFVLQHECWITQYLPRRTVHIIKHKSSYVI